MAKTFFFLNAPSCNFSSFFFLLLLLLRVLSIHFNCCQLLNGASNFYILLRSPLKSTDDWQWLSPSPAEAAPAPAVPGAAVPGAAVPGAAVAGAAEVPPVTSNFHFDSLFRHLRLLLISTEINPLIA